MSPRKLIPLLCLVTFPPLLGATASEKPQKWVEVRSPHFIVATNANEKQARRVADQFERIRSVFHTTFPRMRVDPNAPIIVLAVKDEKSLKGLLPEYWEQKGRLHPAGIFLRGPEKNYVALQLDAGGTNPYHTIYHEYVHLLVDQNGGSVPLWLNEGLAEFYGHTEIHEKDVWLGRASEPHVLLLRENKLLPLPALFAVDFSSPYYNEESKGSIFYAESWALTHFLMTKGYQEHKSRLADFLALLNQNVETLAAATRAFGDLKKLGKELEAYVRQSSYMYFQEKVSTEVGEAEMTAGELPPAESAVLRGDFLVHHQRYSEAKALLAEALAQDSNYAPTHESMGLLELQQGHQQEAKKWFAQAVKLDSRSYLAHYYFAAMTMQEAQGADASAQVESSLRSAIKINPNFAPAYDALATFYGMRGEHLDEAHMLSLQAWQLEPSNLRYLLNGAGILLRMERVGDAVRVGERALAMAKSVEDRSAAQSFLASARQYQESLAAQKRAAEQQQAMVEEQLRQRAELQKASQQETPPTKDSTRPQTEVGTGLERLRASAEGTIVEISCAPSGSMKLTLALPSYKLELHAKNYRRVQFLTGDWNPTPSFDPCKHIKGMRARIAYSVGQQNGGEMISIELKK